MKHVKKASKETRARGAVESHRDGRDGAMSPDIRQLILSFGGDDESDRTWDPDAYSRRPLSRSGRSAA